MRTGTLGGRRLFRLLGAALLLAACTGVSRPGRGEPAAGGGGGASARVRTEPTPPATRADREGAERVERLLAAMTLEERVGQLLMVGYPDREVPPC